MSTLHLMVGLLCSGKTTLAKSLEKECNALLLSTDKWHIKLFGKDTHLNDHNEHDRMHKNVEEIEWEIAKRVLFLGIDVILDFGFWSREERYYFKSEAKKYGFKFKIHYLEVEEEELFKRLEKRNKELSEEVFKIPMENMKKYIEIFEPVIEEEME